MSSREEIAERVSDEIVDRLHQLIEGQREIHLFKDRLVHFLTRYERYLANTPQVTRKERRTQVSRLRDKTSGFLSALTELHDQVVRDINTQLDHITHDDRWEGFDFFNKDQDLPPTDETLEQAKLACERILEVCHGELDHLNSTKGVKKGSLNPSLDQMLIDLAALYETETGHSARSHCYRDETAKDEFNGKFFLMAKAFLDEFVPGSFGTPIALGNRINRVLRRD
ncbi:hypothetical protein MUY35_03130 [Aliiroseovarius sp. S1339]|uniref:hypothetical protein n=1 Tax=Aliiroseovarius sp. S1339 TaxID=2936990 RepID=UPI0020BFC74D|nr:hypothetical protein [Aliiroseovarius sp. S1339]MCK8462839.1 hypothetical protein [Aliiroseovarius sp. S1339]